MTSFLSHQRPLTLPGLYTIWTTSLLLPPTPRLSSLRRLLRTLTSSATAILPSTSLSLLYIDLALTYAFLGEYYLASLSFQEAGNLLRGRDRDRDRDDDVNEDCGVGVGGEDGDGDKKRTEYQAFTFFGSGLAKAELGEWRGARREWRRCLGCFGSEGGEVLDEIKFKVFQGSTVPSQRRGGAGGQEENMQYRGGLSGLWILERKSLEWNLRVASLESSSKHYHKPTGDTTTTQEQQGKQQQKNGHGINGIPANLLFGPDRHPYETSPSSLYHSFNTLASAQASEEQTPPDPVNERQSRHFSFQPLSSIGKASALPPPKFARTWPQNSSPSAKIIAVPAGLNITTGLTPLVPPVSRFCVDPRANIADGERDGDDSPTLGRFLPSSFYSIRHSDYEIQNQMKEAMSEDINDGDRNEPIGLSPPAYDQDPLAYYFSLMPGASEAETGRKYWDVEVDQCLYGKDWGEGEEAPGETGERRDFLQQDDSSYGDGIETDDENPMQESKPLRLPNTKKLSDLFGEEIPILLPRAFEGFGPRNHNK